jgi:catechol-2,3-dioxygenase
MAEGIRLSAAVIFVRDLDRSVTFYRDLLGLTVADSSDTAALLVGESDSQLVLRATGQNAPHSLGSIGVQYLIWNVPTKADLDKLAASLRQHSAYQETRTDADVTVVEGRDPDDLVIMLVHSSGSKAAMRRLPSRIYAW